MAAITQDAVRELAGFRGGSSPVTSCYLDVDGRRYVRRQDYELRLESLLRTAREKANGTPSVHRDLARIEEFVKNDLDRSRTRGLAIFACSERDLFRVVTLPVPVRNQLVVNDAPAVAQLEAVVEERRRFGVMLVDKQRARIFVFALGQLIDRSEMLDELPRNYDQRGDRERGDVTQHVIELAHQHIRRAAQALFDVHQERPFDHVSVGCPDELIGMVESQLHPYLRQRLCDRVALPAAASLDEIRSAVRELEEREERRKEARLVDQLREAVGAGRRGVAGLAGVLEALDQDRAEVLLVSQGFEEEGHRCGECRQLFASGGNCPLCDKALEHLDDAVEEAIELALGRSARVEICVDNADLDVLGRIGALLRY